MTASPPPQSKPSRPPKRMHKHHVAFKEREYFSENLALLLNSDVPIGQALTALSATTHNKTMQRMLTAMQADIDAGYSLANALERSGIVGSQTLALVRLGEQSGHLIENLRLAVRQEEKQHTFHSKVRSALIYPVFVLSVTLVVGLGVAWFLLPRLSGTFSQLHVKLPLVSQIMINFGQFLNDHGIIAVPAFLMSCILIAYTLFFAPKTKLIGQRLLFKMPGIGRLLREVEIAQFGYLFGTLLEASLPVTQAINLLAMASTSDQYKKFYFYLGASLSDGYSIKDSFSRYARSAVLLPPAVQQMVIAGERSGSLSDVLLAVGKAYEQKSEITTNNLEAIMEPILLLFVAVGVMLVAIAVILPIYSLVGGLNQ